MLVPAVLVSYRWVWTSPLLFLLVPLALGWQATRGYAALPPGSWTTPWSGAPCSDRFKLTGDGTAWCVSRETNTAYQYRLATGAVLDKKYIRHADDIFAASPDVTWIALAEERGVVRNGEPPILEQHVVRPRVGAVTSDEQLWYVNSLRRLRVVSPGEGVRTITLNDGLLSHTVLNVDVLANGSIWVGTFGGASGWDPINEKWEIFEYTSQAAVTDTVLGPDGTTWLLQTFAFGPPRQEIWLNHIRSDGTQGRVDLRTFVPDLVIFRENQHAIAVDGLNRVWFIGVSPSRIEKLLGIVNQNGTLAFPIFSLGPFSSSDPFGLLSDGSGGIYLFDGTKEPLRHWRP